MSALSEDLRDKITDALVNKNAKTVTVLSSLLAVEDELGYIPPRAIELVALHTKSTINDVWGVASFYTNFRFTPPGEHVVEICWGPTCFFFLFLGQMNPFPAKFFLLDKGVLDYQN